MSSERDGLPPRTTRRRFYPAPCIGVSPPRRRGPKGKLLLPPAATQRGEAEQRSAEQRERAGLGRRHHRTADGAVVPTFRAHQQEIGHADRRKLALDDGIVV